MAVMRKGSLNCLLLSFLTILFLAARIALSDEGNHESPHENPTVYQCRSHIEAALKTFIKTRHEEPQSIVEDQSQIEETSPTGGTGEEDVSNASEATEENEPKSEDESLTKVNEETLEHDEDEEQTETHDEKTTEQSEANEQEEEITQKQQGVEEEAEVSGQEDQDESTAGVPDEDTITEVLKEAMTDEATERAADEATDGAADEATEAEADKATGAETDEATEAEVDEATEVEAGEATEAGDDEATEAGDDEATEAGDDEATEAGTDEATEAGTDEATEAGTDEATEAEADEATEAAADEATEAAADEATEAAADEATEAEADEATEAAADEATEAEADEATEAEADEATEAVTDKPTDDVTESPTEIDKDGEATEDDDEKTEIESESLAEKESTAEDESERKDEPSEPEEGESAEKTETQIEKSEVTETVTEDEKEESQPDEDATEKDEDETAAEDEGEDTDKETKSVAQEEEEDEETEEKEMFDYRSHEHIIQILGLDDEAMSKTIATERTVQITLKELKRLYESSVKPMENLYKFKDISNRYVGDAELFSKPMILFIGPWSSGKSSLINYILDIEDTKMALRTGAEPQSNGFTVLMYGDTEQKMDGMEVAADWTFSSLQKFGQTFLSRLQGVKLPNNLLRKVTIVDTPGILENRKQQERTYPFNDACQWFIDRADIIYVVFDPTKLDMGLEIEALFDQLKGREAHVRIVLNKADTVKPQELMRVQSTLLWNLSPLLGSAEPPIIFVGTLWSKPYVPESPETLFNAQESALLFDLRQIIDGRVENKISFTRRHAVRVRNHAKMVDCYLNTYYNHKTFFSNKKKIADEIIENPQNYHIYEGLSTLTNVSRYDLPDPDIYRDFFKVNPLYEFKLLVSTCSYFKGCPLDKLDMAISYELPELMGKYRKAIGVSSYHERR